MAKKIIVAATFREFDGKTNDQIQRMFLESLKAQTYKNYIVAVTIFREKNVVNVLTESGIPYVPCYDTPTDYKFSLSIVILNAVDVGKKTNEDYIVLWVNADNMLELDFFERVASACEGEKVGGIVYPHVGYRSIDDYKAKRKGQYGWFGIDCAFFTSDVFTDECISAMKKYVFYDFLYFEFFMNSLAKVFCQKRVNLWPRGYNTVTNDYASVNQTVQVVKASGYKNMVKLKGFCHEYGLPEGKWYHTILYYKLSGRSLGAIVMTVRIYLHLLYADSVVYRGIRPRIMKMFGMWQRTYLR